MKGKPCRSVGKDGKACGSKDFTHMTRKVKGRGRGGGKLNFVEVCWRCGAVREIQE